MEEEELGSPTPRRNPHSKTPNQDMHEVGRNSSISVKEMGNNCWGNPMGLMNNQDRVLECKEKLKAHSKFEGKKLKNESKKKMKTRKGNDSQWPPQDLLDAETEMELCKTAHQEFQRFLRGMSAGLGPRNTGIVQTAALQSILTEILEVEPMLGQTLYIKDFERLRECVEQYLHQSTVDGLQEVRLNDTHQAVSLNAYPIINRAPAISNLDSHHYTAQSEVVLVDTPDCSCSTSSLVYCAPWFLFFGFIIVLVVQFIKFLGLGLPKNQFATVENASNQVETAEEVSSQAETAEDASSQVETAEVAASRRKKRKKSKNGKKKNELNMATLTVSSKEIGKGSFGTIVYEGEYLGRPVAVKRILRSNQEVADREIAFLKDCDEHINIVRLHTVKFDENFVYLALEKCQRNLYDYILEEAKSKEGSQNSGKSALWKSNDSPSSQMQSLIKNIVEGLAFLHKNRIIHRDLKPHNVLLTMEFPFSAKLADMGISRIIPDDMNYIPKDTTGSGSSGWRAPELLQRDTPQNFSIDLFSLGCIIFFCITGGYHPFGDEEEARDSNIIKDRKDLFRIEDIHEAKDLIPRLLDPNPLRRPEVIQVKCHPLLWNSERRISFLQNASNRFHIEQKGSAILQELERIGRVNISRWNRRISPKLLSMASTYRSYDYDSIFDLVRIIRNTISHYLELPREIQQDLDRVPEGFEDYFFIKFPSILMTVYQVIHNNCKEEDFFKKYFTDSIL